MKIRSEDGASAVEFAIVAPLLFVLLFGIIEFGLLLYDKAVITNASREGARAGVVANYSFDESGHSYYDPMDGTTIDATVSSYLGNMLVNFAASNTATTEAEWTLNSDGEYFLTVTVRYSYNFLVFPDLLSVLGGSFSGLVNLVGRTQMRMELAEESYAYTNFP